MLFTIALVRLHQRAAALQRTDACRSRRTIIAEAVDTLLLLLLLHRYHNGLHKVMYTGDTSVYDEDLSAQSTQTWQLYVGDVQGPRIPVQPGVATGTTD